MLKWAFFTPTYVTLFGTSGSKQKVQIAFTDEQTTANLLTEYKSGVGSTHHCHLCPLFLNIVMFSMRCCVCQFDILEHAIKTNVED